MQIRHTPGVAVIADGPSTTRDALMDAGVRLIADRGFRDVTVGDIEGAAGFVARGGTLYKHFGSKAELLDAAMRRHIESLENLSGLADVLPLPDLRSELHVIGRWILRRMDHEEQISRVIEKEANRLPHLIDEMRDGVSEPGYLLLASYLESNDLEANWDPMAVSVVLLGGLVNLRRSTWTFGQPPGAVDDGRAIDAWVELCMTVLNPPRPR